VHLQGKGAYGIGAAKDANDAIFKALRLAILGAINIPLYRGHTVYYPSRSKYVRTKISIFPRPADFGISASPIITEACELLGIQNLTVKVCCSSAAHALLALNQSAYGHAWLC
jgi:ribosomal protein S5